MRNPLRGIRFALLDFNNAKGSIGTKIAMVAIISIPLIYGALFPLAFYDPYGNIDKVPVAVVNEDRGATLDDGSSLDVGDELVQSLKDSDEGMKWEYVDAETANAGMEDGTYYMALYMPPDLSERVASAESDTPEKGELVLVQNEAKNLIASMIGSSAVQRIQAELNSTISERYFDTIFTTVSDSVDKLQDAVEGSGELSEGLETAYKGSDELETGLKKAYDGSKDLKDGADKLLDGTSTLKDGTGQLVDGSAQLLDGAVKLSDGTGSLVDGSDKLQSGAATLTHGLADLSSGADQLDSGLGQLADGSTKLYDGATKLDDNMPALVDGASQIDSGAKQLSDGTAKLKTGAATLDSGLGTLESGATSLDSGLGQLSAGADRLVTGSATLQAGAETLAAGVNGDGTAANPGIVTATRQTSPTERPSSRTARGRWSAAWASSRTARAL